MRPFSVASTVPGVRCPVQRETVKESPVECVLYFNIVQRTGSAAIYICFNCFCITIRLKIKGGSMKTAVIQTRVDAELKKQSEKLLSSIGLDMTSAIRLFLTQVVNQRKIPFESSAPEDVFNDEQYP
jgi:addiction module RelB/DinJ family antitoxin